MAKICKKCRRKKELSEFYKCSSTKNLLMSQCKKCIIEKSKKWQKNNKEKVNIRNRKWRKNNPEKSKESSYRWIQNNRERFNKRSRNQYKKNPERAKERGKNWYKNNTEKSKKRSKMWAKNNPERIKELHRKSQKNNRATVRLYVNNKRKNNIQFKLKQNISAQVRKKLKKRLSNKNGKSTWFFLPYTVEDLIKHLESLFQTWMNWQNYGNKPGMWCIDHKYPDSLFNYKSTKDEEFQKCWALENLQPMEYIENIKKGNKIIN